MIAGLISTLFITDVIPQWKKEFEVRQLRAEEAAIQAAENTRQAAHNVRLAKWAIYVSVAATFVGTWWQIEEAKDIDRENTLQQERIEKLIGDQLELQRDAAEQQLRETERLYKLLTDKMNQPLPQPGTLPKSNTK